MNADFSVVLFDMDGTIADTTRYHNEAWIAFAEHHLGVQLQKDDERFVPGRTEDIVRTILGRDVSPQEVAFFHDDKERRFHNIAREKLTALPGLKTYLQKLKAMNMPVALVTNAPRMNIDFTLKELAFEDLFGLTVGSEDVPRGKPAPDPFLEAARRLGVSPEKCLVYEDSLLGITSAVAAGCQVCAVLTSLSCEEAIALGAKWTIEDYVSPLYPANKKKPE